MANETRVNLQHLLEDIRDSYTLSLEEVIITELIANALDSGASRIAFFVEPEQQLVRCVDNGRGMRRRELRDYHNIAATTKVKGKGIGFAGLGAKLSLLIASAVVTETRGPHGSRAATTWHLASSNRAPWKFVPFSDIVPAPRGTAVSVVVKNISSPLLNPVFLRQIVLKHFFPLLDPFLQEGMLRFLYRKGVEFLVQGEVVQPPALSPVQLHKFSVSLGRARRPLGLGYLAKHEGENSLAQEGLAVSTFGKVIKRGWEWFGILPQEPEKVFGAVEAPALAELLTTNKTDFLNDAASLKKYYRYRKAIQEAVLPLLRELGEERSSPAEFPKRIKPIARDIERTLGDLVPDFPELSTLVGVRSKKEVSGKFTDLPNPDPVFKEAQEEKERETQKDKPVSGAKKSSRGKAPGLSLAFEEFEHASKIPLLGRMTEDTVVINTAHPAWQKAQNEGMQESHIIFTVALVLSSFLEEKRSPQEFVSRFLFLWSAQSKGSARLFALS